jgi:hypothetical protein
MDDLKKACSNKIKDPRFQFKGESLMAAFLFAERLDDHNLKEKCLKIVKRSELVVFLSKGNNILLLFYSSNRKLAVQGTASKNWLTIVQDYPELANEIIKFMA